MRHWACFAFLGVVMIAGCSSSDHKVTPPTSTTKVATTGLAVGRMHIVGGPIRRNGKTPDQPLPGVVEVRPVRAGKYYVATTVRVGPTGEYRITLRPGHYWLHGQPKNTGIMAMNSKPFALKAGQTTHVDLVEYAP